MTKPIYLDNQATTPLDPEVLKAMLPFFHEKFGNASSVHHVYGVESKEAVEKDSKSLSREVLDLKKERLYSQSGGNRRRIKSCN